MPASCMSAATPRARRSSPRSSPPCGAGRCASHEGTMLVDLRRRGRSRGRRTRARGIRRARRACAPTPSCSPPAAADASTGIRRTPTSPPATAWPPRCVPARPSPTSSSCSSTPLRSRRPALRSSPRRCAARARCCVDERGRAIHARRRSRAPSSRRATSWPARSGGAWPSRAVRPVLLDATALGAARLARRFPGLDAACRDAGYDWSREPVPITPAAHYAMGGVVTDLDGRTSAARPLRRRRDRAHRRARRQPARVELAARGGRVRRPGGACARRRLAGCRGGIRSVRDPVVPSASAGTPARHAGDPAAAGGVSADSSCTAATERRRPRRRCRRSCGSTSGSSANATGLAAASARLAAWRAPEVRDRRTAEDRNLLDLARLTVAAALARSRERRRALPLRRPARRPPPRRPRPSPPSRPTLEKAA